MTDQLGFLVFILRHAEMGDCSNGGPSSTFSRAIVFDDNLPKLSKVSMKYDAYDTFPLRLIRSNNFGYEYIHAVPFNMEGFFCRAGEAGKHRMFGGNFIYSSDSRFAKICRYPIPIHDRVE